MKWMCVSVCAHIELQDTHKDKIVYLARRAIFPTLSVFMQESCKFSKD